MVVLRTRASLQTVQIRLPICRLDMARQRLVTLRLSDLQIVSCNLQIGYGRHMGTVDGSYNLQIGAKRVSICRLNV